MRPRRPRPPGFTMIELMIVVAILGILAATAMPAFTTYLRRSKTSEAYATLDAMFKAVGVYYIKERMNSADIEASHRTHCTIPETDSIGPPIDTKQAFVSTPAFSGATGIAFPTGYSYYQFTNVGGDNRCGHLPGDLLYTLTATGNLDGDGDFSTISMATGSNDANEVYKAAHIFVQDELE